MVSGNIFRFPGLVAMFVAMLFALSCKKSTELNRANRRMLVVLDAAHGGSDTGSKSDMGVLEKDLVLQACNKMAVIADNYNIDIIRTRIDDRDMSGDERLAIANRIDVDLFISVHIAKANNRYEMIVAHENPMPDDSRKLVASIYSQLAAANIDTQYTEKGVYVLKNNSHPAIAIECGNIDNPDHVAIMQDENRLCKYILSGIVTYANSK